MAIFLPSGIVLGPLVFLAMLYGFAVHESGNVEIALAARANVDYRRRNFLAV